MLVPVREYGSASEMLASLAAIRRGFLDQPCVVHAATTESEPKPEPEIAFAPISALPPPAAFANDNQIIGTRHVTVTDIIRTVSRVWSVRTMDIISARRTADVMRPRMTVYALACHLTPCSLPHIGRMIGRRDHSSVLHGREKMRHVIAAVSERMQPDASLQAWAEEMFQEMGRGGV